MRRVSAYRILTIVLLISTSLVQVGFMNTSSYQDDIVKTKSATAAQTAIDEIVWEVLADPDYLDPHINYESMGEWIFDNVYETLYTYSWTTDDGTPDVPQLATDLTISPDGLDYTFTLRQGVTFHDGTPFNASCVKYNLERVLAVFDYWGPAWLLAEPILGGQAIEDAVYSYGEGSTQHVNAYNTWLTQNAIEVLSTYVVRIHLAYEFVPFLAVLTYYIGNMISPSYIEAHGGVTIGSHNSWMETHTCGTGPYKVTEYVPNDHIQLQLNTVYWRETQAKTQFPNAGSISQVTFDINAEVNSRIMNLENGYTDGCYWPASRADEVFNGATGNSGDGTLKSSDDTLKVWAGEPSYTLDPLGFNMHSNIDQGGIITKNPFTIKEFREAVSYAFNYNAYIDSMFDGVGIVGEGPIPVGMWGHDDTLPLYSYDITSAVASWNAAMSAGLDSILETLDGDLKLYYNTGNVNREASLLMVKAGIEAILAHGSTIQPTTPLTVTLIGLEYASYMSLVSANTIPIYFSGWIPDYSDPHEYARVYCHSYYLYGGRLNLSDSIGWDEVTVDGWIVDAMSEASSSIRLGLYENIQTTIVQHAAYLWVIQYANFHVERARMNGYVFNPMRQAYFYHYYKTASTTTTSTSSTTTSGNGGGGIGPDNGLILLAAGGGGIALILIVAAVFIGKRRGGAAPSEFDYPGVPPDDGLAAAELVTPEVVEEPPPVTRLGKVLALRGGEIVGGDFDYKVKVTNDTDYVINNVTVTVVAYPHDCMNLDGTTVKQLSRIEPGGFRSPQFKFTPSKDCVEGQVLATVSYVDHQNRIRTVEVEPFVIRSVCDLLLPLQSSMEDFDKILTNMQCTSEEHQLEWNPKVLFDKAKVLLPDKNFYIVDEKTDTMAGEFVGAIKGFAEGKYTNKKVAVRIRISGEIDGNQSRVIIEGLGDDSAMLPTTIEELSKGIEAWICLNCGSSLDLDEVSNIKKGDGVQCKYCQRSLTIDLYRK
jgi:peptide/nickel transport system substrate-binding protein